MPDLSKKLKVTLSTEMRAELQAECRRQSVSASRVRRARVLLMSDENHAEGRRRDWEIAEAVQLSERQVVRIRQKFVNEGVQSTLQRQTRSDAGVRKVLDGEAEAQLVTLCCSTPPDGRDRWTLQLLCTELARLEIVESVCPETVRQCLKKMNCNLGERSGSVFRKPTGRGSWPAWRNSSMSTKSLTTQGLP